MLIIYTVCHVLYLQMAHTSMIDDLRNEHRDTMEETHRRHTVSVQHSNKNKNKAKKKY